jgi:ADP-heptose:LPS heptosyltransferase/GT2 family glycosyltransferase
MVLLRALGLGDLLTAVPALRALADAFPDHERVLAAPAWLAPLVRLIDAAGGEPAVHRLAAVGELEELPSELGCADLAVNLHGRGPQSHRLLQRLRPHRLLGFEHAAVPESAGLPAWRPGEHEVERWCRLLAESGVPADPARLGLRPPPGGPPADAAGSTLVHPGAASASRRWPAQRFAAVARAELDGGRRVVITGSRAERALAEAVAGSAGLPAGSVLAGRTDLGGLALAVAAAGRVVCGDTGVAHLATALGTPSVVLFGPTPPSEWGPPAGRTVHRSLWAGRRGDPHAGSAHAGLLAIEPEAVLAELGELPDRTESSPERAGNASERAADAEVGVGVVTRNRRDSLLLTLERLTALGGRHPLCVVDNASDDGTPRAVRAHYPQVRLVELTENRGGAARNVAVEALGTPLVAFSDDDSWWEEGALERAARAFGEHPRLGLLAARIRVGSEGRLDPTCREMSHSPLAAEQPLPGPPVLGFVACGAVVRASAFRAAGGFQARLGIHGEEQLLALDLAARGWGLAYVDEVVAHHHPAGGNRAGSEGTAMRNDFLSLWLRRPLARAAAGSARLLWAMARRGDVGAIAAALKGLPWALARRRVVPPLVERQARLLERRAS